MAEQPARNLRIHRLAVAVTPGRLRLDPALVEERLLEGPQLAQYLVGKERTDVPAARPRRPLPDRVERLEAQLPHGRLVLAACRKFGSRVPDSTRYC